MSFGGFDDKDRFQPMNEINTTPLVDVMLVLLIIFIITAPLLTHSVQVNLPKAGQTVSAEKPDIVTLSLNAQNQLFWNDQPISEDDLTQRLNASAQRKPQPEIRLRADRDTRYQRIAEIMHGAQAAGIERLGFVSTPATH